MATQGEFLVGRSVEDCSALLMQLEQARRMVTRIAERMKALGAGVLAGYQWPEGYGQSDFVALYNALDGLPGSIVDDGARDKLYKLVSSIQ